MLADTIADHPSFGGESAILEAILSVGMLPTEGQDIGNQIDATFVLAGSDFVDVNGMVRRHLFCGFEGCLLSLANSLCLGRLKFRAKHRQYDDWMFRLSEVDADREKRLAPFLPPSERGKRIIQKKIRQSVIDRSNL